MVVVCGGGCLLVLELLVLLVPLLLSTLRVLVLFVLRFVYCVSVGLFVLSKGFGCLVCVARRF